MQPKIPVHGGAPLAANPFAALNSGAFPSVPSPTPPTAPMPPTRPKTPKRGVVHLRIEKSGRGGKTVTVLFGPGIEQLPPPARVELLRSLKAALGTGGTVGAADTLEVQGDERPRVAAWLRDAGFAAK
ncbi:MAG: translation initiation factor [Puniceicoccales bacterium]|jgi:translation initiation factor 1|nr:translation initiation factor [Puniceicoccales bacterium]